MQRTDDALTGNDSIRQWATAVWATTIHCKKFLAEIKHGNRAISNRDLAAFTQRNVVAVRDPNPLGL